MSEIRESDIQSYIDRQADRDTWTRVEDHLYDRPEELARVREARDDTVLLRRYFNTLESQIPDRHIAETSRLIVEHGSRSRFANIPASMRVAAMVVFLLLGSATVFGIKLSMTVPAYADAAALAYLDVANDVSGAAGNASPNPAGLIEWLNEKTGLVIRVPHAEEHGFNLKDGRLTVFDRHAAGLLVYEDWRKHRVVVFVTRVAEDDDPTPHFAFDRSTYINYWSRNGVGVVIAAADEGDLKEFTEATRKLIDVSVKPGSLLTR